MRNSKLPLLIFGLSFGTFVLAFGALLIVFREELQVRMRQKSAAMHSKESGQASTASILSAPVFKLMRDQAIENMVKKIDEQPLIDQGVSRWIGRVVSDKNEPVPAAHVHFLEKDLKSGDGLTGKRLGTFTTNEDGQFEAELQRCKAPLEVFICAEGFARWHKAIEKVEAGVAAFGKVELTSGEPIRIVVRDESGRVLPEVRVVVEDPSNADADLKRPTIVGQTDAFGRFHTLGADFGDYRVSVHGQGYARQEKTQATQSSEKVRGLDCEIVLSSTSAYIRGSVFDDKGNTITKGQVKARPVSSASGTDCYEGRIDEQGAFEIGPLPATEYALEAVVDGMSQRSEIVVNADSNAAKIVVEFCGSVNGSIVADAPLQGELKLTLLRQDERGAFQPFHGTYRSKTDLQQSMFVLGGLPPGTYRVRLAANGFAPSRSDPFTVMNNAEVSQVSISLSSGGRITGTAMHPRGYAIGNVRVTVFEGEGAPPSALKALAPSNNAASTVTSPEGEFEFAQLSPGLHAIALEAEGLPQRTLGPLVVSAKDEVRLGGIILGGGSSISGRLLERNGRPIPGGKALLYSEDQRCWIPLAADRAGNFSVRGLSTGAYFLRALDQPGEGTDVEEMRIELLEDQHVRQDLCIAN